MYNDHNSLQCIVPPYMVEKIIENGTPEMRQRAIRMLTQANFHRMERSLRQEEVQAARSGARGLMAVVTPRTYKLSRQVFDAQGTDRLPGNLVRKEGDAPSVDVAVNEAYDAAGDTFNFYLSLYRRYSIDGLGLGIDLSVHYEQDEDPNNAYWNGQQMLFGDGDGSIFARFTIDLDVTGHELTHGVVQYTVGLRYLFQSGALNESFADVFGSLIRQFKSGQTAKQADWLVGPHVLIGDRYALRSLKAPGTAYVNHPILGTDPQPATMEQYITLPITRDNGGVHINSGIPNHAFYLAATKIGGNAWEKAGLVWYKTLNDQLLNNDATFVDAAEATMIAARQTFGQGSNEEKYIEEAWKEVKVI